MTLNWIILWIYLTLISLIRTSVELRPPNSKKLDKIRPSDHKKNRTISGKGRGNHQKVVDFPIVPARSVAAAAQEGGVWPGPSLSSCNYQHIMLHRHNTPDTFIDIINHYAIYFNFNSNHPSTFFINCCILIKLKRGVGQPTSILIVVSLQLLTFEIPIQNQNLSWTWTGPGAWHFYLL